MPPLLALSTEYATPISVNCGAIRLAQCGGLFIQLSTAASGVVCPAATFSPTERHLYPARVARSAGVLPSLPVWAILLCCAMSAACASDVLLRVVFSLSRPAAAKRLSPHTLARVRASLTSSRTRFATVFDASAAGGENGAARMIQVSRISWWTPISLKPGSARYAQELPATTSATDFAPGSLCTRISADRLAR